MFAFLTLRTGRPATGPSVSAAIHCGIAALLFLAGTSREVRQAWKATAHLAVLIAPYLPPEGHGGGGGGDRSPLPACRGALPRIAPRQFTPPIAVVNTANPKLVMEPTLVITPDVMLPQANIADLGDPFGRLGPKSNGPGFGGGIGSGGDGGVGPGKGPGLGPGEGGDHGGGVRAGGGATISPVLVYKIEPEFSEEARQAKHQGVVVLYAEVDTDGHLRNVRVLRGLGLGLDEKAIEAVKQWRFRPGYRDGKPVIAAATIEVNFHLL